MGVLAIKSQCHKPGVSHHVRALCRYIRPWMVKLAVHGYYESRYDDPESAKPQHCVGGFVVDLVWCQAEEEEAEAAF